MKSSGEKLRTASVILLAITLVLALISGIYEMIAVKFLVGLITLVTNGLTGLLAYIMLQAFADISDNTADVAETNRRILQKLEGSGQGGNQEHVYQGTVVCPKCGKAQPAGRSRCINCGEMLV